MKREGLHVLAMGLLGGAVAALAMPPLHWLPLAVVGLVILVWQWDAAADWQSALWRGWAWGLGHFAVGSYWIVEAFFVPPADFALVGPPMVLGLAAVLGFFPALAMACARWLALRLPLLQGRYRRLILLALAWTVAEWLRGHVFTGYPWNPLGHVWAFATPLLQGASVVGIFGLGTLSFLVLASPVAGWQAIAVAAGAVGVAAILGLVVLPPVSDDAGRPKIRIVQPNTPQAEKYRPGNIEAQVGKLIALSRRPGFENISAVVWPETALPFVIFPSSPVLTTLGAAAPPGGYLLTGAARATDRRDDGVWNSLLAIVRSGEIVAHYDKVHLVPFGEYIPYHKEIAPISGLIGRGSFEVGDSQVTLALPGLPPFSPLICFEAIFPAEVTGPGARPAWLLNVTNDAWFGVSSGPYQHLTSARLRSVEEGLPMVRAANTGVSAMIDAYGRVLASLDMAQTGVIDRALPPERAATPYARWHDWTLLVLLVVLGIFALPVRLLQSPRAP